MGSHFSKDNNSLDYDRWSPGLPEIPGIKKNEKAISPQINKYKGVTPSEPIFISCKKYPIKIPKIKKISKFNLCNKALKKSATYIDKKIMSQPNKNRNSWS